MNAVTHPLPWQPVSVALVLVLGCGVLAESPVEVARQLWSALQTQDSKAIQGLCTTPDTERLEAFVRGRSVEAITLGAALTNESEALVETTIVTSGGKPLSFNTHLHRVNDSWKVVPDPTLQGMRRAALEASMHEIGDALREGLQILGDALEEGARVASDALAEALEQLQQEFGAEP